jgi:hypothetical protein
MFRKVPTTFPKKLPHQGTAALAMIPGFFTGASHQRFN